MRTVVRGLCALFGAWIGQWLGSLLFAALMGL
jgi:hypothetical protein